MIQPNLIGQQKKTKHTQQLSQRKKINKIQASHIAMINQITQLRINTEIHKDILQPT